jgi:hypothetical protein
MAASERIWKSDAMLIGECSSFNADAYPPNAEALFCRATDGHKSAREDISLTGSVNQFA